MSRPKLTYANVAATLALFGVLAGGGAWAADKIGSKQIKASAVSSKHVKNDSLGGADIDEATLAINSAGATGGPPSGPAGGDLAGTYPDPAIAVGAVGGTEVASDSLTGADVDESTLGQVPQADAVDGTHAAGVTAHQLNGDTEFEEVLALPGIGRLEGRCGAEPGVRLHNDTGGLLFTFLDRGGPAQFQQVAPGANSNVASWDVGPAQLLSWHVGGNPGTAALTVAFLKTAETSGCIVVIRAEWTPEA